VSQWGAIGAEQLIAIVSTPQNTRSAVSKQAICFESRYDNPLGEKKQKIV
jgi:hypothetical protein